MGTRRVFSRGFTLIELLVVVGIIALLLAILMPSLGKARAQARTTLCATQIGAMTRSLFIYAEDYNERFPFHIKYGALPEWGGGGYGGAEELDETEDWIASQEDMPNIYFTEEQDWPDLGVKCPQSGSLFPYTRFEKLYACPEFIRRPGNGITDAIDYWRAYGDQRVFNYTRGAWCRKPNFQLAPDFKLEFDGPIMTASMVHAPATAYLLLDESWYCHVGRGRPANPGFYVGADPVWDIGSSQGVYHGAPMPGDVCFKNRFPKVLNDVRIKRGSVSYYDGHVDLDRDPCPMLDSNTMRNVLEIALFGGMDLIRMMEQVAYSLLGKTVEI